MLVSNSHSQLFGFEPYTKLFWFLQIITWSYDVRIYCFCSVYSEFIAPITVRWLINHTRMDVFSALCEVNAVQLTHAWSIAMVTVIPRLNHRVCGLIKRSTGDRCMSLSEHTSEHMREHMREHSLIGMALTPIYIYIYKYYYIHK